MATRILSVDEVRRRLAALDDGTDAEPLEATWTDGERATCLGRPDPAPGLAARLAAKQAALEALGLGDGTPLDVEIRRADSGKPELLLHGAAARRGEELGVDRRHVTLTHLDAQALAVVVLERSTS